MSGTSANRNRRASTRVPGRPPGLAYRPPGLAYWLIAKSDGGCTEPLTIERGGDEMLPVFNFEEEAGMFLQLECAGSGWRVRKSYAGELVSILCGSCREVDFVAVDPLPEIISEWNVELASTPSRRFIDSLGLCSQSRGGFHAHRGDMALAPDPE